MAGIDISKLIETSAPAVPQIYAYTAPGVTYLEGFTKIGYTERDVEQRIREQTHTAGIEAHLEWHGNAVFEGGGTFRDTSFHAYLSKLDVARRTGTEWFDIEPAPAKEYFRDFRENRGLAGSGRPDAYTLRKEQEQAVEKAAGYRALHAQGEFLWNAKPRFGKTLSTYELCKRMGAQRVLIATNRPAIADSWYSDYARFVGNSKEDGYCFISSAAAIKSRPLCMSREEYLARDRSATPARFIEFLSLQDLKGSVYFGGKTDKLEHVAHIEWDVLVIDEAHEGVDTLKTDVAFDHIKREFTLHLSGTPFKAIANEKFPGDAIYNWTYADEQQAKRDWDDPELPNPYADLPRLNMLTYKMSDIVADEVSRGACIDGETVEYAFDLNEFFATKTDARGGITFVHGKEVDAFLDALTQQEKFPFSTPALRGELRHTLWMLNRVDSARALARKLKGHPVFKDYEVVLAAGDGRIDDEDESARALDKVRGAIASCDETITLSVGQLTVGTTVPEWTAVLMLSSMKSASLYMQAAFRAQNPCLFDLGGGRYARKENAYIFDFDPARTLAMVEEFANDLYSDTAAGAGTLDERKQRVRTLLNFFPVIGEDPDGEMVELDAEGVLSIPRKIRSQEVVRRGFMSNFLFQNIGSVFSAAAEVVGVLQNIEPYKAPKADLVGDAAEAAGLDVNGDGEVEVPEETVIGISAGVFGAPVYEGIEDDLDQTIESMALADNPHVDEDAEFDKLRSQYVEAVADPLLAKVEEDYGGKVSRSRLDKMKKRIKQSVASQTNRDIESYKINRNIAAAARDERLESAADEAEIEEINREYGRAVEQAFEDMKERMRDGIDDIVIDTAHDIVREVETARQEERKQGIENDVRDRLRGFSRTIPSFLMAYGTEETTLATFDQTIPDDVFLEVTGITTDQFRFLRDGGDYADAETGETRHFDGHLFDPVVFDDSVREFIALRGRLANYFDESQEEDIFDYVPPQKTNQIFTPKKVVRQMVDMLEEENPGCFDDPSHTFADLYMKSGLYITEIVKRLYNSKGMRAAFPDDRERLEHIFGHQVFGLAPTEIIYRIATNFILGFAGEDVRGFDTNFVLADAAALAQEGRLADFVEETFGEKLRDEEEPVNPSFVASKLNAPSDANYSAISSINPIEDWILTDIMNEGCEIIDKRESGGNLWVIGNKSLRSFMRTLEKKGARFTYKPEGGRATKGRPAWYIPASAANRAIGRK